jgi:hypothetical protein
MRGGHGVMYNSTCVVDVSAGLQLWIGVSSCKLVYLDPSSNSQLGRFSTLYHSTPVELEC